MTTEQITLAAGCFWCVETIFKRLSGVEHVESGYTGGKRANPTYEQVSTGVTGHAEAIQITYDPQTITLETLLDVFWKLHDPTTLNRQGADVGTQYRSAIFYHTPEQKKVAEASKKKMDKSGYYKQPIVTEIVPFETFYKAEDYHQDYYAGNTNNPYCRIVIDPKIQKLYKDFKPLLKPA